MAKKTKKPAAAAPAEERSGYIAKAPIRRLMKTEGAGLVAEDAVELLISTLEQVAVKVTKTAVKIVKGEGRKRVTATDVAQAEREL
jgi:histone H3/H4